MQTADYVNRMAHERLSAAAAGVRPAAVSGRQTAVRREFVRSILKSGLRWMHFFGRKSFCAHTC